MRKELAAREISRVVIDPLGIHARRGDNRRDGKRLLALMKLRVKANDALVLRFEGAGEEAAAAAMQDYLAEIL